jgi:hypothetical protein
MRLARALPRPLASFAGTVALALSLLPGLAGAQPTVRDHRGTSTPSPAPAPKVVGASGNALAKYTIEMLRSNPPEPAPREPIVSLQVEFRCPACAPNASTKGVNVEVWHAAAGGSPRLVGIKYNVELKGQGGSCQSPHDSTCFGVPAGSFPAAEGTFIVKLIKDNEVASSSFNVVAKQLKIFGPTLRDHRTQ